MVIIKIGALDILHVAGDDLIPSGWAEYTGVIPTLETLAEYTPLSDAPYIRQKTDAEKLSNINTATWAAQATARKDRAAQAALAEPDSSDPEILRRKLNAALHLLNSR